MTILVRVVNPKTYYDLATMTLMQAAFGYQDNLHEMEILEFAE